MKTANRLINEDSPYLLQHAYNPVDWYPWGDEAFLTAKRENKPIFLSIGYSTCHWCHVMEREVFEDEELARLLNSKFVSIKVDREERPDLDKHFQHIHYIITRRGGGWPTSIFLTPDKKPFFAATYIPPRSKGGMMGFGEVVTLLAKKLQDEPQEVFAVAQNIERAASMAEERRGGELDFDPLAALKKSVLKSFDKENGGILGEPKFPHAALLRTMLKSKDRELADIALFTLRCMARGGMYDIVDGGFCRYSVDSFWLVPHFEKMAYDNGLLMEVYSEAYKISGDFEFLRVALECAEFMLTKMSADSLFYSASDADSEGEEGKYFVYSYDEALAAFERAGIEETKEKLKKLGFSKAGNFEHKNIPRVESLSEIEKLKDALLVLKEIRKERVYPFIDTKIITSWNAMVITALFCLGEHRDEYRERAFRSLAALESKLFLEGTLYHTAISTGTPKIEAFLEDYAYLAKAYLLAFRACGNESYRQKCALLVESAIERFFRGSVWAFSVGEFETTADPSDSSYTSSVGILCEVMLYLGGYEELVLKTLRAYSSEIKAYPLYYASLLDVFIDCQKISNH